MAAVPLSTATVDMDMSQPIDISSLVVTGSSPERRDDTAAAMDYTRCAALHNYLVQLGWVGSGMALEDLPDRSFTFFSNPHDSGEADEARSRLSPSVAAFLELARIPNGPGDTHLFAWAHRVATPSEMFSLKDLHDDEGEPSRFLTLYVVDSNMVGDPAGLIYDQERHRATFAMDMDDLKSIHPVADKDALWFPLETVLSSWVRLATIGKVTASTAPSPTTKMGAWAWHSYSEAQVDGAVAAFDRLSTAIEARMPAGAPVLPARPGPLLSAADLDAGGVPTDAFIRKVLSRVRVPGFNAVAPGLLVPHDGAAFAAGQRFARMRDIVGDGGTDGVVVPPVLIFAAAVGRTVSFDTPDRRLAPLNPFRPTGFRDSVPPGDHATLAGLYTESGVRSEWWFDEAGFRLVLPFALRQPGEHGPALARQSDLDPISERSVAELFQHGFRPFGGFADQAQSLEKLLDRWRELVETGVWRVGRDGVEGSIDSFRDASRGSWRDYWIPPGW